MKPKREYVGDGVYAEMDECGTLKLMTDRSEVEPENIIYLEHQVWSELVAYYNRSMIALKEERKAHANRR